MRIQGPNPYINIYKNQQKQQQLLKTTTKQNKDELKISNTAKSLQQSHVRKERLDYVNEIKERVEKNEYRLDSETIANKLIDFWSNK